MATATARRPSGPVLSAASQYRSASPTRVKLAAGGALAPATSVSVSSSSSSSPGAVGTRTTRRSCMCSLTNHQGSFRCSLHKERKAPGGKPVSPPSPPSPGGSSGCRLGAKRMGSPLVRIGAVEGGQWASRALAATARPSAAAQHRRRVGGFRPQPSRLSAVSVAGDRAGDNDRL